jgi:hypothetical protein
VGIGDTDPVGKFHIKGSGTSGQVGANLILENSSSGTAGLQITGSAGSSHLDLMYGGGPGTGTNTLTTGLSMTLEGSDAGNVGIGTDDPQKILHIKETGSTSAVNEFIRIENHALGGTGAGSSINFHHYHAGSGPSGGAKAASIASVNSQNWAAGTPSSYSTDLTFGTLNENSFDERMRIDSSGNVGIGTDSPNPAGFQSGSRVLSIQGDAADDFGVLELLSPDTTGSNRIGEIRFGNLDGGSSIVSHAGIRATRDEADDSSALSLWTTSAGTFRKRLNIANSGDISFYEDTGATAKLFWDASEERLGIGITNPDARVEIRGAGATTGLTFKTSESNDNTTFWVKDGGGVGVHYYPFMLNQDHDDTSCPSSTLMYVHHGTSPFIIKSDGKVGIGMTDPSQLLEINGTDGSHQSFSTWLHDFGTTGGSGISNNMYYSGGYKFRSDNYATHVDNSSGTFSFKVAPSGTADNAIGWTTAMTIENDGDVTFGSTGNKAVIQNGKSGDDMLIDNSLNGGIVYQADANGHTFKTYSGTWLTALSIKDNADVYLGGNASASPWSDTSGAGTFRFQRDDGTNNACVGFSSDGTKTDYAMIYLNLMGGSDGNRWINFARSGTQIGTITLNGTTGVSYNTTSDYRLKENVVPMTGSIDRLKELKPSKFNFITDADKTVDGFLAHEVSDYVPEAISGEKDAMKTEEYTVSEALGEVFTPAVEEVTEEHQATETVEAQDAVMGERQVTETVETGSYVNLAGETIIETSEVGVTEEATETVVERQTGEDGITREVEVERTVNVPVMETYEESPAIEAVAEVTETVVTTEAVAEVILETDVEKPEELTEGQQWRETTAKVTAEREVPNMQGIDQSKLVPLLVGALQEAIARIETLENT